MKLRVICIYIARVLLNGIYTMMKLFPTREQICFFSRQSDSLPLDFLLLMDRMHRMRPELEMKIVCCRFYTAKDGCLRFAWALLRSMYYLARAKVCVLDGYWPAVCLLKHKSELKVIQLWHSNGKIKKSGYQTLGTKDGRNPAVAQAVRMHKGYDCIIAGGVAWNPYYCQCFGVDDSKLLNFGLPRMDRLLQEAGKASDFRTGHPELQDKIVVLYAPTFRKKAISFPTELVSVFEDSSYELICRFHPRQDFTDPQAWQLDTYKENTFELLTGCDWLITDYSSLALEAAALRKRTLYYLYDHESYINKNGVNIDLFSVMPHCCATRAEDLIRMIESDLYPWEELERYRMQYLPEQMGHSTENICKVIEEYLDGKEIHHYGRRSHAPVGAGAGSP